MLLQDTSNQLSTFSAAMNASSGISTLPNCHIFFLPFFCFSRSLRPEQTHSVLGCNSLALRAPLEREVGRAMADSESKNDVLAHEWNTLRSLWEQCNSHPAL